MKIAEKYSALGIEEFLLVRRPDLWNEIGRVIESVDASELKTKVSKERARPGQRLYSPVEMNMAFKSRFAALGWHQQHIRHWSFSLPEPAQSTNDSRREDQEPNMEGARDFPTHYYCQTDFVKERVALEVQFGSYSFVAHDILVKHRGLFVSNVIDVAIEIVPMKALEAEMSPGVPYYERVLYNLLQLGHSRSSPSVPLMLVGIAP